MFDEAQIGLVLDQIVKAAPDAVIACNLPATIAYVSDAEAIRGAMIARDHGADIIYSSGNTLAVRGDGERRHQSAVATSGSSRSGRAATVAFARWARPSTRRSASTRRRVAYQNAGASSSRWSASRPTSRPRSRKRVDILVMSLGSGPGCDGQFLFSADLLGVLEPRYPGMGKPYDGPLPRHAKRYTNLFEEARSAFTAFKADVASGEFPTPSHTIRVDPSIVDAFRSAVDPADDHLT